MCISTFLIFKTEKKMEYVSYVKKSLSSQIIALYAQR